MRARPVLLVACAALAVGVLGGCGSTGTTSTTTSPPVADSGTATDTDTDSPDDSLASALTVSDAWAKAADSGMTAAFATLTNPGTADVTVTAATASASNRAELHEMATKDGAMVMRVKEGGIVVPAGGSVTLKPGGDHIMLLDLRAPVKPGDNVQITLDLSSGRTVVFDAVAKEYAGAQETYRPSGNPSMSMS